ncbi:MAG TPA: 5-oxoprolinase subunit PxpA [Solirubrobacteraceae bacterium]|nr:5-oxoprolinase subunit PxpA [Solirubrobacteraceae bacterium]
MPEPDAPITIDLNADVGEGVAPGGDRELLELVTSASVACGFHAGDAHVMRATCAQAAGRGIRLGAHVSYDDREGFGRRELDLPPRRVADDVVYQLGALAACARAEGAGLRYVKPHGALYGRANADPEMARALVGAIAGAVAGPLAVMTPPGSALAAAATDAGVAVIAEGFADRGYAANGSLRPRGEEGAVLGPAAAAAQAVRLATTAEVSAAGGRSLHLPIASLCVHSDTPGALAVARAVRVALHAAGVIVTAQR